MTVPLRETDLRRHAPRRTSRMRHPSCGVKAQHKGAAIQWQGDAHVYRLQSQ